MLLALLFGDFDEVVVRQKRRFGENRRSDGGIVMTGQLLHDHPRRRVDGGQFSTQLRKDLFLDLLDQQVQDIAEEVDLFVVVLLGITQKKIGHAPKHGGALFCGATIDGSFEVIDKR